jgi:hypothetical protein
MVAAERVVTLGHPVRLVQSTEVPRPLVMVEDDLLVEVLEVGHHTKILRT